MPRINYNKEVNITKTGRSGPRDIQRRQHQKHLETLYSQPNPQLENVDKLQPSSIDMSQYLALSDVHKKIENAVISTRSEEQNRYQESLDKVNKQLKDSETIVTKLKVMLDVELKSQEQLNVKLVELEKQIAVAHQENISEQIKIVELETQLTNKELIYTQSSKNLDELNFKLDKLYDKISDGSIEPLVGSKIKRPILEDKIFIDPIEKSEGSKLDPHINVKEDKMSKESINRDVTADSNKLKNLLRSTK